MNKNRPLWSKLIIYWCNKLGRYGLTIPFIVEAERRFGGRIDFDINCLIDEITNSDQAYTISDCVDLEELVLGLSKKEYPPIEMLKKFRSLAVNVSALDEVDSLNELKEILVDKYHNRVLHKEVSKNYTTKLWSDFDSEDIADITEALN